MAVDTPLGLEKAYPDQAVAVLWILDAVRADGFNIRCSMYVRLKNIDATTKPCVPPTSNVHVSQG